MPDRAVIPAVVAVSFGFLGGLAAAAFQMDTGPLIALLVAGSVATIVAGTASVAGEGREGGMVAIARSALAALLFILIVLAMIAFLAKGELLFAFIWVALAAAAAVLLTRTRPEQDSG